MPSPQAFPATLAAPPKGPTAAAAWSQRWRPLCPRARTRGSGGGRPPHASCAPPDHRRAHRALPSLPCARLRGWQDGGDHPTVTILLRVLPLQAARQVRAPRGSPGQTPVRARSSKEKAPALPSLVACSLPTGARVSSSFLGAATGDVTTPLQRRLYRHPKITQLHVSAAECRLSSPVHSFFVCVTRRRGWPRPRPSALPSRFCHLEHRSRSANVSLRTPPPAPSPGPGAGTLSSLLAVPCMPGRCETAWQPWGLRAPLRMPSTTFYPCSPTSGPSTLYCVRPRTFLRRPVLSPPI